MKILSQEVREDGMIVITTDYTDYPVFVYPIDKFNNVDDLMAEMLRRINSRTALEVEKQSKRDALIAALEQKISDKAVVLGIGGN